MKYFDIIREKFQNPTSFDLGGEQGKESSIEKLADGCADSFIDELMSGYGTL